MTIANDVYFIKKPNNNCLLCGADIVENEKHPSLLEFNEDDSTRKDYCFNCWAKIASQKFFSFWIAKRIKPGPDKRATRKERNTSLIQIFISLYNSPNRTQFRAHLFLLAHLLMRYQIFKWKDTKTLDEIKDDPTLLGFFEEKGILNKPPTAILSEQPDAAESEGEQQPADIQPENEEQKNSGDNTSNNSPEPQAEAPLQDEAAIHAEAPAAEPGQTEATTSEIAQAEVFQAVTAQTESSEGNISETYKPTRFIIFAQKGTDDEFIIEDISLEDESLVHIKKEIDAALAGSEIKENENEG